MVLGRPDAAYFSFLPGPEKLAPHLADRAWKKSCIKEDDFALLSAQKINSGRRQNPITWDDISLPGQRMSTGRSDRSKNVLSLESSRLGTASTSTSVTGSSVKSGSQSSRSHTSGSLSSRSHASRSQASGSSRSSRVGKSRLLGTAGSYRSSVSGSDVNSEAGLSSILSHELDQERKQRQKAEEDLAKLQVELNAARSALEDRTFK